MKKAFLWILALGLLVYWCSDNEEEITSLEESDQITQNLTNSSPKAPRLQHVTFNSTSDVWNYLCQHRFVADNDSEFTFTYGSIFNNGDCISRDVNAQIINDQSAVLYFTSHLINGNFKLGVMVLDDAHFVIDPVSKIAYYEKR